MKHKQFRDYEDYMRLSFSSQESSKINSIKSNQEIPMSNQEKE